MTVGPETCYRVQGGICVSKRYCPTQVGHLVDLLVCYHERLQTSYAQFFLQRSRRRFLARSGPYRS